MQGIFLKIRIQSVVITGYPDNKNQKDLMVGHREMLKNVKQIPLFQAHPVQFFTDNQKKLMSG